MNRIVVVLAMVLALAAGVRSTCRGATSPELEAWHLNTSGRVAYGGLRADVQRIRYSACSVYISASGIPLYGIRPWPASPIMATDQHWVMRFPRTPAENTEPKTLTPPGVIGMWINGVVVFNALDAHSYNNLGVWHPNAVVAEAASFDACLGRPAPGGAYYHNQNPRCLYTADASRHSAILGFAFDGFPIYGPYAFKNSDGSGAITRIRSSYRLRNITDRTVLPDGTVLSPPQYGPSVASVPLGYYVEDFEYVAGLGDLDAHNGRFATTPEYPAGTYAYFVTIDETGASAYPYTIGPSYFGIVARDDIASHGHVTNPEALKDYTPSWIGVGSGTSGGPGLALAQNVPNPAGSSTAISFTLGAPQHVQLGVYDVAGRVALRLLDGDLPAGAYTVPVNAAGLSPGIYFYRLRAGGRSQSKTMIVVR